MAVQSLFFEKFNVSLPTLPAPPKLIKAYAESMVFLIPFRRGH